VSTRDVTADLHRAARLVEIGRYQEAATSALQVLAVDPDNAHAACLLAQAALGLRDYRRALSAAQSAVRTAPEWWWPRYLASIAWSQLSDRNGAVTEAREAVRLAPEQYVAHLRLAEEYLIGDDLPAARVHGERALQLAPTAVGSHFAAGRLAHAEGRRQDAEEAYSRALAIDPNHAPSHNELARLRLRGGRWAGLRAGALADAAGSFATGVRADPRNESIRRNLDVTTVRFLSTTAYLMFLAAYLGGQFSAHHSSGLLTAMPLILLAVPSLYAARFIARLPPPLRVFLRDIIRRRSAVRAAMVLELVAVVCIVLEVLAPQHSRITFAFIAYPAAFVARLLLWDHTRALSRGQSSTLTARLTRGIRRAVPGVKSVPGDAPLAYTRPRVTRARRLRNYGVSAVVVLFIAGVLYLAQRPSVAIAGAPGYSTLSGPYNHALAVGRPWGQPCQPVLLAVDVDVPGWVYTQAATVVREARRDGIDVALESRNFSWAPRSLYYRDGQTRSTTVTAHLSADFQAPPASVHIELGWNANADPDGQSEDLTDVQGTLWLQNLASNPQLARRSIRQFIALTQGILHTSRPGSGIADSTTDRFTSADVAAMLLMSGCSTAVIPKTA
jgi:tetratricopeptide (TPR) repeat protein